MPEMVILPAFFVLIGFIVWITITSWQRRQRVRMVMDFNTRLIDRLGSVNDFSEFAKTAAGTDFLNSMLVEAPGTRPGERILRSVHVGIVLIALGLGLLALGWYFRSAGDIQDNCVAIGVIALALGIGSLLASAASYRLSASMGLLAPQPTPK